MCDLGFPCLTYTFGNECKCVRVWCAQEMYDCTERRKGTAWSRISSQQICVFWRKHPTAVSVDLPSDTIGPFIISSCFRHSLATGLFSCLQRVDTHKQETLHLDRLRAGVKRIQRSDTFGGCVAQFPQHLSAFLVASACTNRVTLTCTAMSAPKEGRLVPCRSTCCMTDGYTYQTPRGTTPESTACTASAQKRPRRRTPPRERAVSGKCYSEPTVTTSAMVSLCCSSLRWSCWSAWA